MKFKLLILFLFFSASVLAQNTFPTSGNVGIGTTNPLGKIHIAGVFSGGIFQDPNDRPGIGVSGNYPQAVLMAGGSNNPGHGSTVMLGSYDSGTSGTQKHWSLGTSGQGSTFLDIGYSASDLNPHAGIRNYNGSTVMTLLNTGNVGIGVLDPAYALTLSNNKTISFNSDPTNPFGIEGGDNAQTRVIMGASSAANSNIAFGVSSGSGSAGFTEKARLTANGNLGIGTSSPMGKLHIAGAFSGGIMEDPNDRPGIGISGNYPQAVLMAGGSNNPGHGSTVMLGSYDSGTSGTHKHWSIGTSGQGSTFLDIGYSASDLNPHAGVRNYHGSTIMTFLNSGYVGIGTLNPDAKLTVKGNIHAEEVKVDLSVPGPDYVFEKHYDLKPLSEVQQFIDQNKHLPEIPSAKTMKDEGLNVGEMQMKLLQKIEELTLYLIDQKKEINALKQEVAALKK